MKLQELKPTVVKGWRDRLSDRQQLARQRQNRRSEGVPEPEAELPPGARTGEAVSAVSKRRPLAEMRMRDIAWAGAENRRFLILVRRLRNILLELIAETRPPHKKLYESLFKAIQVFGPEEVIPLEIIDRGTHRKDPNLGAFAYVKVSRMFHRFILPADLLHRCFGGTA